MIVAYEAVFENLFSEFKCHYIFSFPIDRYPMDVMNRVALRYNIRQIEITVCLFKETSMFLERGQAIEIPTAIKKNVSYEEAYNTLVSKNYKPSYVKKNKYNLLKWFKVFFWQYARDIAFKFIMLIENDRKSLHYLDSQMYLAHKVNISDVSIKKYQDKNYFEFMMKSPKSRNVIVALQLYPEASIDYWVKNLEIVKYEKFMLKIFKEMSSRGFNIFLKDHPLQFGFRQIKFIRESKKIKILYYLPYDSDINIMMKYCSTSLTTTGTIGLQACLNGLNSIVTNSYYSNSSDFYVYNNIDDIKNILDKIVNKSNLKIDLKKERERIIKHIYNISFYGDILSFRLKEKF